MFAIFSYPFGPRRVQSANPTFASLAEARAYVEREFADVLVYIEEENGVVDFASKFGGVFTIEAI